MPNEPLFGARDGGRLSRDALEDRIAKYVGAAAELCPTLRTKQISARTLRHTAAMQLLHAGVDTSVIALWLGTSRSTPPRSIYMPISASRSGPSRGQSHRQPTQVGSDRPTRCSPSWRRSDYAELYATN